MIHHMNEHANLTLCGSHETEYDIVVGYTHEPAIRGARDSLGGVRGAGPALEPDEPESCEVQSVTAQRLAWNEQTKHHDQVGPVIDLMPLLGEGVIESLAAECLREYRERSER